MVCLSLHITALGFLNLGNDQPNPTLVCGPLTPPPARWILSRRQSGYSSTETTAAPKQHHRLDADFRLVWWYVPAIPSPGRLRLRHCEFKAYTGCPGTRQLDVTFCQTGIFYSVMFFGNFPCLLFIKIP